MKKSKLLLPCFLLFLLACGTAKRGVPHFKPVPLTSPAVAQGEVVFNRFCQKCHPGGEAGLGPALNNKPVPGFTIRFQIRNGLGVMPAFKEEVISDEELDHLMAYIKKLRKAKKQEGA